jgi:hypothetical protein
MVIIPLQPSMTDTPPSINTSSAHQSVAIQGRTSRHTLAEPAAGGIACSVLRGATREGFQIPLVELGDNVHAGTDFP